MSINISHLNLGRNVRLSVLFYLDFNIGVSTALTDRMFNLQGRIVVPPGHMLPSQGRHPVSCQVLDHLHIGNDALNPLCLAVQAITT